MSPRPTTPTSTVGRGTHDHRRLLQEERRREQRRALIRKWLIVAGGLVGLVLVAAGLWSAVPRAQTTSGPAPDFTLPTTAGDSVTLSALRGEPVIIYFNEGAGCGSCTSQMAEIEKNPGFARAGITVLPIVMNSADQIRPDLEQYGVSTPYLLDDGTVSETYGVLGTGMHAGLPGHSFVLIDADGVQRWSGSYPSMWLDPQELLDEATGHLG